MNYKLILRWDGGTDATLLQTNDLSLLLQMADKLNGYHPTTHLNCLPPLSSPWKAYVFEVSFHFEMTWANIEDYEKPEYVKEMLANL